MPFHRMLQRKLISRKSGGNAVGHFCSNYTSGSSETARSQFCLEFRQCGYTAFREAGCMQGSSVCISKRKIRGIPIRLIPNKQLGHMHPHIQTVLSAYMQLLSAKEKFSKFVVLQSIHPPTKDECSKYYSNTPSISNYLLPGIIVFTCNLKPLLIE